MPCRCPSSSWPPMPVQWQPRLTRYLMTTRCVEWRPLPPELQRQHAGQRAADRFVPQSRRERPEPGAHPILQGHHEWRGHIRARAWPQRGDALRHCQRWVKSQPFLAMTPLGHSTHVACALVPAYLLHVLQPLQLRAVQPPQPAPVRGQWHTTPRGHRPPELPRPQVRHARPRPGRPLGTLERLPQNQRQMQRPVERQQPPGRPGGGRA